jgi:hypothetical protein
MLTDASVYYFFWQPPDGTMDENPDNMTSCFYEWRGGCGGAGNVLHSRADCIAASGIAVCMHVVRLMKYLRA